jgi:hypothetical protein
MAPRSIRAGPLNALEELELAKGCVTAAGKPSVRAAMNEPASLGRELEARARQRND